MHTDCNSDVMYSIFEPSLTTIAHLMEDQISLAYSKGRDIDAVVVIGGFGDSPALKDFLRLKLNDLNRERGIAVEIRFTPASVSPCLDRYFSHLRS